MAHEIKIPSVGESVSEGTLAQWLKADGDHVAKGENIVVIDTEKASQDLPADVEGTLRISVQEGTDVKIGEVIGYIEEGGSQNGPQSVAPAQDNANPTVKPVESAIMNSSNPPGPNNSAPKPTGQVYDIVVPSAGESVSEGTIAQWSKADGDQVVRGEDIVVIDTEKASSDLQADHTGILRIIAKAGEDVKIGQVIGRIEAMDTDTPAEPQQPLHVAAPSPQPGTIQPPDQVPASEARAAEAQQRPAVAPEPGKSIASPEAAAEAQKQAQDEKPGASSAAPVSPHSDGDQPTTREPMTRMRRTIAAHLLRAKQETAMLTTFNEVDMSAIIAIRKKHGEAFMKRHGVKLGFMSFFIQAAADALMRFPLVNASIDGNDII
jgi:2-oxoglutarate dehydrogenase E2 component (dihydrolipoamide succinyltransferase)